MHTYTHNGRAAHPYADWSAGFDARSRAHVRVGLFLFPTREHFVPSCLACVCAQRSCVCKLMLLHVAVQSSCKQGKANEAFRIAKPMRHPLQLSIQHYTIIL